MISNTISSQYVVSRNVIKNLSFEKNDCTDDKRDFMDLANCFLFIQIYASLFIAI